MTGVLQRMGSQRLAWLAPLAFVFRASLPAHAADMDAAPPAALAPPARSETTVSWLSWHPPPECPGADFVLDRVRGWLGGALPEPGALQARGEVHWTGEQWEIFVSLQLGDTTGERRVRVATCADAAEFLAVAIVLAVDPSRGAELPVVEEAAAGAVEVPEEPALDQPAPSEEHKKPAEPSHDTAPAPHQEGGRSWFLGVGIEGVLGALPSFQLGPLVEGGFQGSRFSLALGAHLLPPVSQLPAEALAPISYALAAGRVSACYLPRLGPLELGPCAQLDVGALWTNQPPPGNVAETVPWVDLQAGVMARFFGPSVSVALATRLSIPLTQPRFIVSSDDLVHQPTLGVVFDARVQFFLRRK